EVLAGLVGVRPDVVQLDVGHAAGQAEAVFEVVEPAPAELAARLLLRRLRLLLAGQERVQSTTEGCFLGRGRHRVEDETRHSRRSGCKNDRARARQSAKPLAGVERCGNGVPLPPAPWACGFVATSCV